jgi:hypothetical protein
MTTSTYVSRYQRRIDLVVEALRDESDTSADTTMSEETARRLAVRVLQALDHIPETVR